ncbi:hypothetical protein M752DRAFT_255757 [Aspergillus phoenicis ATCC 13157]|uniref:Alpha-ketoglutarate-dependent sulfonate dioxygenase n=1 Tax=Aspergillus phoenicis ATCC 13157 TaxID=1353007 RepID=A0A370PAY0_ASPPH|nr:hypothetical protein M752DRAFT_255757 [Aspergillus phoenicis ATCC 13157]
MTSFILSDVPTSPSPVPTFITPKQCVTHLKLLSAFAELRDVISNNDGLFGLYDQGENRENVARDNYQDLVREKRWAVYVARAVKRYTDWWFRCLPSQKPLPTMADIRKDAYAKVVKPNKIVQWHEDVLPPLDVLMVWHSHMLNPRKYLEDCIRYGKMCVWGARFPWELVDRQIDGTTFEYTTTGEARRYFETQINSSWDNLFDPPTTTVPCPNCGIQIVVEWTMGQDLADVKLPFEDFTGLADKGFRATCHNCQYQIDHDRLKLAKWRQDVRSLLEQNRPMPGCFYNLRGVPFPFIQQMDRTNWIRAPTLHATISRSIKKYSVFFGIMADNPKQMAVPTLDVDLAWHTHQLSPMQYYNCSVGLASSPLRFMDHNDKVDEVDLTIGFEWTCKAYREVTDGEIYSECVCWFCEAVRYPDLYGHFRSSLLWLSDARKAVDELRRQHDHASKSDNGPHISVHSAVRPQKISEVDRIKRETRALQLLEAYRKTLRRAKKHSRSSKALVSAIAAVNSVVLPTSPPTDTVISQDEIIWMVRLMGNGIVFQGRAVLLPRVGIVSLAGMHLLVGLLQGAVVAPEDVVEEEEGGEGAQDAEAVAGDLDIGNCTTIGSAANIPERSGDLLLLVMTASEEVRLDHGRSTLS